MPTSRNGKLYYQKEQYEKARYNSSALEYAQSQGYELTKQSNYYKMKDHDSMVFTLSGQWFWNSRELKGGAIEFIVSFENKSTVEAVLILNGELVQERVFTNTFNKGNQQIQEQKHEFELPPKAENHKRLFAYLTKERGLDKNIISELLHEKKIYQSAPHGNAVFVGYNKEGVAASAYQRGTNTYAKETFKRDVVGSNKSIPWVMEGSSPCDTVAAFESCIDAISHATLEKLHHQDYKSVNRLALGGVSINALSYYLENNENIKNVILALDNDIGGKTATDSIAKKLVEDGYNVFTQQSDSKDFNMDLKLYIENSQEIVETMTISADCEA